MNLSRILGTSLTLTGLLGVGLIGAAHRKGDVIPTANAAENWALPLAEQPACRSLTPASLGGPLPEGDTVVIRWLGTSNYEVAYRGKVIVMDTFFDRPARTRSVGFTPQQVKRADAILVGHAHYDHISDIATVAAQTRAPVLGSAITTGEAVTLGVPAAQTITVKGDNTEHYRYGDIEVQPTHIIHSSIEPTLIPELSSLYDTDGLGPLTPEQAAQAAEVHAKGSSDPNIITLGTMGFTLTLPGDFTIVWFDSVSSISPEEQQLAEQLHHHVDVGLFPYTPHPIAETQLSYTFQHLQLFAPRLFAPTHHDHIWGAWLDNGVQPLFMKLRDEQPETKFVQPLYRSPICISTSGLNRGQYVLKN
jgi:L-ascorbate metabolism protein UlaG (beta-lactamase superfamily)